MLDFIARERAIMENLPHDCKRQHVLEAIETHGYVPLSSDVWEGVDASGPHGSRGIDTPVIEPDLARKQKLVGIIFVIPAYLDVLLDQLAQRREQRVLFTS